MIAQACVAAVGVWLVVAPAALDYGGAAATNDRIFGPTIAALAVIAATEVTRGLRLVNVPLGLWLVAAPLVLSHEPAAAASSLSSGVVIAGLSLIAGRTKRSYGGGWRSIARG